jgi:hypothetical protein
MTNKTPAQRMAHLYRGGPTHGKYLADFSHMENDGKTGKLKPAIRTAEGAPSVTDFEAHLAGKMGLLAIAATTRGESCWGAIDVDDYGTDIPALAKKVAKFGLPLTVSRTKNGGAHLTWYCREFRPTEALRSTLCKWAADLGYSKVEIFPKQDVLGPQDMGNGLNLPFFGGDAANNYAVDDEGNRLSVEQWLARAERTPAKPKHSPGNANVEAAADLLAQHWTDGRRDRLNIAIIGTMLRCPSIDDGAVRQVIELTRHAAGDTEHRKSVEKIGEELKRDRNIPGFRKLTDPKEDLMPKEAAQEFLRLMGSDPPPDPVPFDFEPLPLAWINEPPPPLTYTVKPLLPQRIVSLMVAEGGAGKTTFSLRMALAVAGGRPLFGMEVRQGKVVYIAMEDQGESLRRRVHWIVSREIERMRRDGCQELEIDQYRGAITTDFHLVAGVGYELHLVNMVAGQVTQSPVIPALIEKVPRPLELLVLDPMSRLNGAEENSNAVGTAMINAAERLARELACTVVIPHHTGKGAAKDKDSTMYAARGASAFVDAARSSIRLIAVDPDRAKDFENVPPEVIARGDLIEVIHNKCNDGPKAKPFFVRRQELDFELFAPAQMSAARVHERIMSAMFRWYCGKDRQPFDCKRVADAKESRAEVFGVHLPSRDQVRDAYQKAVKDGDLVPSGETAERSKVPLMRFRGDYVDPETEL